METFKMTKTLNEYKQFVSNFAELHKQAAKIAQGSSSDSPYGSSERKALLFSPHPDDEAIIGALPLRLKNELDVKVTNVAVSLGSNPKRKEGRLEELMGACKSLGFELILPGDQALDDIKLTSRKQNPDAWADKVEIIYEILSVEQPEMIFFPHDNDFNSTHIGVHYLLKDAIAKTAKEHPDWQPLIVETEFWQMMDKPNLMVGVTHEDEAQLVYAISAHKEEIERNPYHINHPARMLDNVTRGSEVIGGQGGDAFKADFAMIYRASVFNNGEFKPAWDNGQCFNTEDSLESLFQSAKTK